MVVVVVVVVMVVVMVVVRLVDIDGETSGDTGETAQD